MTAKTFVDARYVESLHRCVVKKDCGVNSLYENWKASVVPETLHASPSRLSVEEVFSNALTTLGNSPTPAAALEALAALRESIDVALVDWLTIGSLDGIPDHQLSTASHLDLGTVVSVIEAFTRDSSLAVQPHSQETTALPET